MKITSSAMRFRTVSISPFCVANIHVSTRFRIARSSSVMDTLHSFEGAQVYVVASARPAEANRFAYLRANASAFALCASARQVLDHRVRASFVLNPVIHLVTLARRPMLDPRRVGAASPEAARRRSPLGQISFESFGSLETFGSFMPFTSCRTNDSGCV